MLRSILALSLALLSLAPATLPLGGPIGSAEAAPRREFDRYHQGIFFAVLEGLYRDGVSTRTAQAIVEIDPQSHQYKSFVPGCPICMPSMDAFRLYLLRPEFGGKKLPRVDTFGEGLPDELVARLAGDDLRVRREALRGLVERWVGAYLDRMRLDPAERAGWERELAARSQKGMAILAGLRESDPDRFEGFDECPLCAGAEAGSAGRN
jgi:hypothetical protein